MAQIPDELPALVQETRDNWQVWYTWSDGNVPAARSRVMGAVPSLIELVMGLHSEAQRMEEERNFWRGEAGRLYSLLLRCQEGVFSIPIPFTGLRLVLCRSDAPPPPVLPSHLSPLEGGSDER